MASSATLKIAAVRALLTELEEQLEQQQAMEQQSKRIRRDSAASQDSKFQDALGEDEAGPSMGIVAGPSMGIDGVQQSQDVPLLVAGCSSSAGGVGGGKLPATGTVDKVDFVSIKQVGDSMYTVYNGMVFSCM